MDRVSEEELELMLKESPRAQAAMDYFFQGYNCSQAIMLAFEDVHKLNRRTALTLSCSFGGGMGRLREVCGGVSGMFMVLGLLYGYDDPRTHRPRRNSMRGFRNWRQNLPN